MANSSNIPIFKLKGYPIPLKRRNTPQHVRVCLWGLCQQRSCLLGLSPSSSSLMPFCHSFEVLVLFSLNFKTKFSYFFLLNCLLFIRLSAEFSFRVLFKKWLSWEKPLPPNLPLYVPFSVYAWNLPRAPVEMSCPLWHRWGCRECWLCCWWAGESRSQRRQVPWTGRHSVEPTFTMFYPGWLVRRRRPPREHLEGAGGWFFSISPGGCIIIEHLCRHKDGETNLLCYEAVSIGVEETRWSSKWVKRHDLMPHVHTYCCTWNLQRSSL